MNRWFYRTRTATTAFLVALVVQGAPTFASQQSSVIQLRYNTYYAEYSRIGHGPPTIQAIVEPTRSLYNRLIAPLQAKQNVAGLGASDAALLYQAAMLAQFYTCDVSQVHDMQLDLDRLGELHAATQLEYIEFQQALLRSRMFTQALAVQRAHPASTFELFHAGPSKMVKLPMAMSSVPTFVDRADPMTRGPTEMVLSADGGTLVRQDFDLDEPSQVVVVISPDCHFAQADMPTVDKDAVIGPIFRQHATWLILQADPATFDEIHQWNSAHPTTQMVLAFKTTEWPMFDHWDTPTFYFFKNGKRVAEVSGYFKPIVERDLKQIGLL
jgi:hypothetical protein